MVEEEAKDTEDLEETSVDPVVEEVSQPTVEDVQHTEVENKIMYRIVFY